jgi:hypothetical protein
MTDLMFGEMTGLTNSQYLIYSDAARIFLRVQAYNTDIRTRRIAGNKTLSYYIFADNTERIMYRKGQFILSQNDPTNTSLYQDVVQI